MRKLQSPTRGLSTHDDVLQNERSAAENYCPVKSSFCS